jgi:hypothetical protein
MGGYGSRGSHGTRKKVKPNLFKQFKEETLSHHNQDDVNGPYHRGTFEDPSDSSSTNIF